MKDDSLGRRYRRRVLILDFDFYTAVGGGQVFYRRVVERNPCIAFYYPSTSPDVHLKASAKLPANAFPFAFDERLDYSDPDAEPGHWIHRHYSMRVAAVAAAVQGMTYDLVDIPSFSPVAHLARQILTSFGVCVEKIALGLVGWPSVSARNGYEKPDEQLIAALEAAECGSVEAADVRYNISHAERTEHTRRSLPVTLVDVHDAIEAFRHGPMIHLPRKLAYWRLHASNLTTSSKRREMAAKRITLIRKLFMDPHETVNRELVRKAYAAAHAAAAAILGRDEDGEARKHLRAMAQLAPELITNFPPNMASYPQIWLPAEEAAGDTGALNGGG